MSHNLMNMNMSNPSRKEHFREITLRLFSYHGMTYEAISEGIAQYGESVSAEKLKNVKRGGPFQVNTLQLRAITNLLEYVETHKPKREQSQADQLARLEKTIQELEKEIREEFSQMWSTIKEYKGKENEENKMIAVTDKNRN